MCAIALIKSNGEIIEAEGRTDGEILFTEQGEGGFGYDPLFYSYDLQKSFGMANSTEKNAVIHRARALTALEKKVRA